MKRELKKFCENEGIDLFGVADIGEIKKDFLLSEKILEDFDKAVCLGVRLSKGVLDEITDSPTRLYFHHYRTVNMFLDQVAFKVCNYIQKKGFLALPIPASQIIDWKNQKAHLSHKKLGVLSGLGWIGRNNLLVNKDLGSQFRMVSILTNMPLEADGCVKEDCGNCRLCIEVCPVGAIKEDSDNFDHIKCFEKLKEFQKQRLVNQYICGICVRVCQGKNRDGSQSKAELFRKNGNSSLGFRQIKKQLKNIVFIIILFLFFPSAIFAEIVTLKSGKIIEGEILEETDEYIKIDCQGKPLYYKQKYIRRIEKDGPESILPEESVKTGEISEIKDATYYLTQGLKYATKAKFDEAERAFEQGLNMYPNDHNLKEAIKLIEELKSKEIDKDYALYLFKGSDYLMQAQYREALAEFKKASKIKGDDPDLNYYLGISSFLIKQYDEAIGYLQKALGTKMDDEVYYYIGVSYYSKGEIPEAIKNIEKTLEINSEDADAHSIMGACLHLTGDSKKAKHHLQKSIELFKEKGDYLKAIEIEEFLKQLY